MPPSKAYHFANPKMQNNSASGTKSHFATVPMAYNPTKRHLEPIRFLILIHNSIRYIVNIFFLVHLPVHLNWKLCPISCFSAFMELQPFGVLEIMRVAI